MKSTQDGFGFNRRTFGQPMTVGLERNGCAPQKLGRAWILPVKWAPDGAGTRDEDRREQALLRSLGFLAVGGG